MSRRTITSTSYRAQLPETHLSAFAALVAAVVVLTAVLTHHQNLTHAVELAAGAHTAVVLIVLYRRPEARPLAVLLATGQGVAALAVVLSRAVRRTHRQEVWA